MGRCTQRSVTRITFRTNAHTHTRPQLRVCNTRAYSGVEFLHQKVKSTGPHVLWQPSARWVSLLRHEAADARARQLGLSTSVRGVITSSGVSAGIDMTLALVAEWAGRVRVHVRNLCVRGEVSRARVSAGVYMGACSRMCVCLALRCVLACYCACLGCGCACSEEHGVSLV